MLLKNDGEIMTLFLLAVLLFPFLGTTLGAGTVILLKGGLAKKWQAILAGVAAGVMVAASFFSLLLPAIDRSASLGFFAFFPATLGVILGFLSFSLIDLLLPSSLYEGKIPKEKSSGSLLFWAVTLHNIPEGMAVGVAAAAFLANDAHVTAAATALLSFGIGVQNFPEGAIISLPLVGGGMKKRKAFLYGFLSGIVEPLAAAITLLLSFLITPLLPYLLSLAAGVMLYVVIKELVPEGCDGGHATAFSLAFAFGFCLMMALDVALG